MVRETEKIQAQKPVKNATELLKPGFKLVGRKFPIRYDSSCGTLYTKYRKINLNENEQTIFQYLLGKKGECVATTELIAAIETERGIGLADKNITEIVFSIRRKLDSLSGNGQRLISTIAKKGYLVPAHLVTIIKPQDILRVLIKDR